jgi:hypothetical protein
LLIVVAVALLVMLVIGVLLPTVLLMTTVPLPCNVKSAAPLIVPLTVNVPLPALITGVLLVPSVMFPDHVFELLFNTVPLNVMALLIVAPLVMMPSVVLAATVTVLAPRPDALPTFNVPALMAVVPLYVLLPDNTNVPLPVLLNVLEATPVCIVPDIVNVSLAFTTLIVSVLLAVLSNVTVPDKVLLPLLLLSMIVLPLFNVIAFAIVRDVVPKLNVPPLFTVTLLVPNAALLAALNTPALMLVVPL